MINLINIYSDKTLTVVDYSDKDISLTMIDHRNEQINMLIRNDEADKLLEFLLKRLKRLHLKG